MHRWSFAQQPESFILISFDGFSIPSVEYVYEKSLVAKNYSIKGNSLNQNHNYLCKENYCAYIHKGYSEPTS